jgi:hypothetical protein
MLFALFPLLGLCESAFWSGSPLILNITVLLATAAVVCAGLYFLQSRCRKSHAKQSNQRYRSRNAMGDFKPEEDTNPNRPLAVFSVQDKSGNPCIAGNVALLERMRHITPEVRETINMNRWVNALERLTES